MIGRWEKQNYVAPHKIDSIPGGNWGQIYKFEVRTHSPVFGIGHREEDFVRHWFAGGIGSFAGLHHREILGAHNIPRVQTARSGAPTGAVGMRSYSSDCEPHLIQQMI